MKIAIDIDNTVFTNNSIVYKLLNNRQILGKPEDTELEYSSVEPKTIPTKGFLKKLFPFINPSKFVAFKDSINVINLLFEMGHEIIFLSNRPIILKGPTLELLDKYDIKYDALILGCKNKHTFCKEFGIDVLIDDQLKNCTNVASVGVNAICLDHKPTEVFPERREVRKHLFHASNWKTVEHLISYMEHFKEVTEGINVVTSDLRERKLSDIFRTARPLYSELILSKHFKDHLHRNNENIELKNLDKLKDQIIQLQNEKANLEEKNKSLQQENDDLKRK